jgi:choline-phosphate cytidylyltransferase
MKERGMFLSTQRTEGISTSDIITKIIRDYDKYLMRNFARGATRQELNVSWLKKNELEFKKHINEFRSYWRKTNDNLNNASRDLYFEVREYLLKKSILKDKKKNQHNKNRNQETDDTDDTDGPAERFAADFTGEHPSKNKNPQRRKLSKSPSFIDSLKDWMQKNDNDLLNGSDRDSTNNLTTEEEVGNPAKKPRQSKRISAAAAAVAADAAADVTGKENHESDQETLAEN